MVNNYERLKKKRKEENFLVGLLCFIFCDCNIRLGVFCVYCHGYSRLFFVHTSRVRTLLLPQKRYLFSRKPNNNDTVTLLNDYADDNNIYKHGYTE